MKTAQRCSDGGVALYALLASQLFVMGELFTFTLADGTVLRYTTWEVDQTVGGDLFHAAGGSAAHPALSYGKTRTIIGVEVDTMDVSFGVNTSVTIGGMPVPQFARQGGFDGARVKRERVFMPATNFADTSAGTLIQFLGRVAEVHPSRTQVDLKVNSDLELLNIQIPRNLYQAGCVHTLYDAGCTVSRILRATSVLTGSTAKVLNCGLSDTPGIYDTGFFDLGVVGFTSGANNGLTRTIKQHVKTSGTVGTLYLAYPLPVVPTIGDTFNAVVGCDKQQGTCEIKFVNLANFKGAPYIPAPESSY